MTFHCGWYKKHGFSPWFPTLKPLETSLVCLIPSVETSLSSRKWRDCYDWINLGFFTWWNHVKPAILRYQTNFDILKPRNLRVTAVLGVEDPCGAQARLLHHHVPRLSGPWTSMQMGRAKCPNDVMENLGGWIPEPSSVSFTTWFSEGSPPGTAKWHCTPGSSYSVELFRK